MKDKRIRIGLLVMNEGQIPGVPKNPRSWTWDELDLLKESIRETPMLMDIRGCIVYPYEGRYVVLGGNMRYLASKAMGHTEVMCHVLDEGLPASKLREIVMKDNASFGSWQWDKLKAEWLGCPLQKWGIDAPSGREAVEKQTVKAKESNLVLEFQPDEFVFVQQLLLTAGKTSEEGLLNLLGYGRA